MEIKNLLYNIDFIGVKNLKNFDVENLSCDSKERNDNGIFFCIQGTKQDGHNFVNLAENNGAKCLVVERYLDSPLMQILVANSRKAMTQISAKFYEIEKSKMKFIAITGTNGKTTSTFLIKAYLEALGKRVGLIGTQGIFFDKLMLPAKLTTPDPIDLHKAIHEMEFNGIEYCVMEASAHSIALNKIDGIKYDVVGLTNITQDHLDFFKTMDNYAKAKGNLCNSLHTKNAIINVDDDYCYEIFKQCDCNKKSISLNNEADYFVEDCDIQMKGTKAVIKTEEGVLPIKTNLVGSYNLANTMMAIAVLKTLGFELQDINNAVNTTKIFVPGRYNVLKTPTDFSIVVDFAHTPDGMLNVIKTTRQLTDKRIICVFGCGGDRDARKRSIMGKVASKLADYSVVTSDNPRNENPNLIIEDIVEGMGKNYEVEENRKLAIKKAIELAKTGDVILILGKGAENYQEIKGKKYAYSDYDVVDEYFKTKFAENKNEKLV